MVVEVEAADEDPLEGFPAPVLLHSEGEAMTVAFPLCFSVQAPFCCGRAMLEKKPGSLWSYGGGSFLLLGIPINCLGSVGMDAGGQVVSGLQCSWIPSAVWRSSQAKLPSSGLDAMPLNPLGPC